MPANFTTPVAQPTMASIPNVIITWDLEAKQFVIMAPQIDTNGKSHQPERFILTDAQFFTAYQAATGTGPREKAYNLVLTLMGQTGTVV